MSSLSLFRYEIPYSLDTPNLFERIRDLPRPVLLDSNSTTQGMDIIAAAPCTTLTSKNGFTRVTSGEISQTSTLCPLTLLQEQVSKYPVYDDPQIPFTGGAIGYLSYDLGRRIQGLSGHDDPAEGISIDIPEMDIGIYLWAIVRLHGLNKSYFIATPECPPSTRTTILRRILGGQATTENIQDSNLPFELCQDFISNFNLESYTNGFRKIMEYIHAGDCYQANFAQRFATRYSGDEWRAYLELRTITDGPYSGFIDHGDYALLSLSPECFLQKRGTQVCTWPIKGTTPRQSNPVDDKNAAYQLQNSQKDQAENLMIVDLMRNDLSKDCLEDSVSVPRLFTIKSYSNVHHMVSCVEGTLKPGRTATDLLRSCFPGGSITGAPKRRAMEIIDELEPHPRTAYCGSLLYLSFSGNMDSNIAIRTIVCHNHQLYCWGGGGIVADSLADSEYKESSVKVSNLLQTLAGIGRRKERIN